MTLRHGTRRANVSKRAFDLVVGTPLALASLPVIMVLAAAIAVTFRTWPFFVQRRVGRGRREFWFPKIRTLPPTAPPYADQYRLGDVAVPRLAAFLRRHHLDELPQLLLVPLGVMSLVGPRPKMPDDHEPAPEMYVRVRTLVPQGVTGLWQVSEALTRLPHETPEYDYFYVQHRSLRLDAWVLWRTARSYLPRARPLTMADIPAWALQASTHVGAVRGLAIDLADDGGAPDARAPASSSTPLAIAEGVSA